MAMSRFDTYKCMIINSHTHDVACMFFRKRINCLKKRLEFTLILTQHLSICSPLQELRDDMSSILADVFCILGVFYCWFLN